MKGLLRDIADFFLPRTCHLCGCTLRDSETTFCVRCIETLPRSLYHLMPMNPMERRFAGVVPFVRATGHFIYSRNSELASAVHDMKYRQFPSVGKRLGEIVGEELMMVGFFSGADSILAVPMHWWKKAKRGYNQVDCIAQGLSDATGLPVLDAIEAVKPHKTQTSMTLEQRHANLAGSFRVKNPAALAGRGVVLVDDVCTTGATLRALAEVIASQVPDSRLYILSLCVTV
ncbi:MAG: ComF family protein [Muribaculaceae bacterium]|nr:ComF family protein [Muribaculaceae bacterium]